MKNFKLFLEYDGTGFHGWQKQPGLRTVQGSLEEAVANTFGRDIPVNGAGRTDAGVHALAQVSNFVVDTRLTPEQVGKALGKRLPEDIHIYQVETVDLAFHARFSAKCRRYVYYLRTEPSAIWRRFAHVVTMPLDFDAMKSAATSLVGEHDFASFTPVRSNSGPTVCNVTKLEVNQQEEIVSVTVEADHFLHHMVRVIVGTLIEVGRGKMRSEHVVEILRKKDRTSAGPTMPPTGLFLTDVRYDD